MWGLRTATCVAIAIIVGAPSAHADQPPFEEWKDGCPAFFSPEHVPTALARLPVHTGVDSFGALPEVDSLLGPSRIGIEAWSGRLTQQLQPGSGDRAMLLGGQGLIHVATSSGAFATLSTSLIEPIDGGTSSLARWGNSQAYVGFRHAGYQLGTAFRIGGAIRFGGGGPLFASSNPGSVTARDYLTIASPFREPQVAFDRPLSVTVEVRGEMVGCHAPFIDVRLDATRWEPIAVNGSPENHIVSAVASFSIGGYFLPYHAIYGQLAEEIRDRLPFDHFTRVSIGYELRLPTYFGPFGDEHVGLRVSAMTGDNVTGWEVSSSWSWQFGSKQVQP